MKDVIRIVDDLHDGHGRLLSKGESHEIIGEVEVIAKTRHGNVTLFTRKLRRNDLLVTGAVFLSEKMNQLRSSFLTTPLDVSLGIHTIDQVDRSNATVPAEFICGLTVGIGGCDDTYNTVHRVHRTDLSVPGMVPFRVVDLSSDLDEATRRRYILRVVKDGKAWYYGKTWDTDKEINVQYEDGTIVPVSAYALGDADRYVRVFTKYVCTVDESDIREYAKIMYGSTLKSRVNSVGLITGYQGVSTDGYPEFYNVRGMTTLNMENGELKDDESTIMYVYRVFIA